MDYADDWKDDPLVRVQDAIVPVMWLGGRAILSHQMGQDRPEGWRETFEGAVDMLSKTGADLMSDYGVVLSPEDVEVFTFAAEQVKKCTQALEGALQQPPNPEVTFAVLRVIQTDMHPAVEVAINRFRKVFINLVIAKQRANAEQTKFALSGLDKISKQIFFIAINASVEAAHVGDAGRGFLQISTDMRALSQSAQNATHDLSKIIAQT